jgi:hypothetical protein
MLPSSLASDVPAGCALNYGLVTRPTQAEAWTDAHARFPDQPNAARVASRVASRTDSTWKSEVLSDGAVASGYWRVPAQTLKSDSPFYIGSYHEVARLFADCREAAVSALLIELAPTSTESESEPSRWQVHFERSSDGGASWTATQPLNGGTTIDAIQPSILFRKKRGGDALLAVGRTREGKVFTTSSDDAGRTWSALSLIDDLPNPNAGIDAVTLADGRQLIVYNPVPHGRTPLAVAVSQDGRAWTKVLTLEDQPGEYSYPAVIQTRDGLVRITYTYDRKHIKYVVVDPRRLH